MGCGTCGKTKITSKKSAVKDNTVKAKSYECESKEEWQELKKLIDQTNHGLFKNVVNNQISAYEKDCSMYGAYFISINLIINYIFK